MHVHDLKKILKWVMDHQPDTNDEIRAKFGIAQADEFLKTSLSALTFADLLSVIRSERHSAIYA